MNLDFSCNMLSHRVANQDGDILTPALAGGVNPIGIHILPGGELANVGKFDAPNLTWEPGANVFPVADNINRAQLPASGDVESTSDGWSSPPSWTSIYNEASSNRPQIFRWKNEFIGNLLGTIPGLTGNYPKPLMTGLYAVSSAYLNFNQNTMVRVDCDNINVDTYFPAARVAFINSTKDELPMAKTYLAQSIPNPVSGQQVLIPYGIEGSYKTAQIEVFELSSGKLLGQYGLAEREEKAHVSVQGLAAGIYGYRLVVDGQPLATRKMVLVK